MEYGVTRGWMRLLGWICVAVCLLVSYEASARDVRVALLVGHEQGWRGEQKLRFALRGDLQAMSRAFQRLGFEVQKLANPTPSLLRKALRHLKQRAKDPRRTPITTFFFYYTGHAGSHYFHLGKSQSRPFHYKELMRFLLDFPVKRRFALLDACFSGKMLTFLPKQHKEGLAPQTKGRVKAPRLRHFLLQEVNKKLHKSEAFAKLHQLQNWFQEDRGKGIKRRRKKRNTSKIPLLKRKKEMGLQIIASSQGLSWERPDYRSSVFTYHWLRGLKGAADTNLDGHITMDELYQYTQTKVLLHAGQRSDRFALFRGSYVLAPHYRSRLRIGPTILGKLKLSVGHFVWHFHKRSSRAISLPVVHGKGWIIWQRKQSCWLQKLNFPKEGEAKLTNHWSRQPCQSTSAMLRKGSILLKSSEATTTTPPNTRQTLAFTLGGGMIGADTLQGFQWLTEIHYRREWFGIGLHISQSFPSALSFQVLRFFLQSELGASFRLGPFDCFIGGRPHLGISVALLESGTVTTWSLGINGQVDASWWITPHVGLKLGGLVGIDYTPLADSSKEGIGLRFQLALSGVFALSGGE